MRKHADNLPISEAEAGALFRSLAQFPALVLAVSGGPDSTALLWLVARWRDALKDPPRLVAVTIDHGLRKESAAEARAVAKLARRLKVAHRTVRWRGRKPKTGIQAAARDARYALLVEAARKARAHHIVTAHTQDDQAETVLFRLARGSGVSGLKGMAWRSALPTPDAVPSHDAWEGWLIGDQNVSILRPFLETPKSRLIATLRAAKVPFVDDPSNRDVRFARPRLRELMPLLAAEGLDARRFDVLARRIAQVDDAIEHAVREAEARLCAGDGPITIDAGGFSDMPYEVCQRVVGRAVAKMGHEGPVELAKLEDLFQAILDAWMPQRKPWALRRTLAGALITVSGTKITVEPAPPRRTKRSAAKTSGSGRKGAFTNRS